MTQDRDIGTPQRHAKGHRIVDYQPLRDGKDGYQQKAGELVALVLEECSLDVLYHRDLLGKDKDRRYAAGLWLRELYLKTHPSTTVSAYHDAASRSADISSNTTDAQSWNLKVWLEHKRPWASTGHRLSTSACSTAPV